MLSRWFQWVNSHSRLFCGEGLGAGMWRAYCSMIHDISMFKCEVPPLRFFYQDCTENTHSQRYLLASLPLILHIWEAFGLLIPCFPVLLINTVAFISNNSIAFFFTGLGEMSPWILSMLLIQKG